MKFFIITFILFTTFQLFSQVEIVVTSLPENNPKNLKIYLTGNFNEWQAADEKHELKINSKGYYSIFLDSNIGSELEFKFIAGDWNNIESDGKFFPRPNRKINTKETSYYEAKIDNWQELSRGTGTDLYVFSILIALILSSTFIGLVYNKIKSFITLHFILPIVLTLGTALAGIIFFKYNSFLWQNYLDTLKWLFCIPILWFFIHNRFSVYKQNQLIITTAIVSLLFFLILILSYTDFAYLNSYSNYISILFIEYNLFFSALIYFFSNKKTDIKQPKTIVKTQIDSDLLIKEFEKLVLEKKLFLDQEISVEKISRMMGIHRNHLSKMVNDNYNQKFSDFINQLRINEFISLANEPETLLQFTYFGLAQKVGFNSKSAFNRVFKKFTNKTPTEYFKSSSST